MKVDSHLTGDWQKIPDHIKQLESDPFAEYVQVNDKGTIITGTVKEVDAKAAVIELNADVEATLKASEMSQDRIEDLTTQLKVGDEVEAKIINVDRKNRVINLSVKSKDIDDTKEAMKEVREKQVESAGPTTIGDLIKAQMENK
mgnify:CR=1 FL=1